MVRFTAGGEDESGGLGRLLRGFWEGLLWALLPLLEFVGHVVCDGPFSSCHSGSPLGWAPF